MSTSIRQISDDGSRARKVALIAGVVGMLSSSVVLATGWLLSMVLGVIVGVVAAALTNRLDL